MRVPADSDGDFPLSERRRGQNEKNKFTADPDGGFVGDSRNIQPIFTGKLFIVLVKRKVS